mmetsp:Transcript_16719/g.30371  ORF Transcript_16719/g.30371 Transcript_16719/m.30371 type:complete len:93 (-) Transcript_16719:641-919(-)
MIASDIHHSSIASARDIVRANGQENLIDVRHQVISKNSFDDVLCTRERIDFALCPVQSALLFQQGGFSGGERAEAAGAVKVKEEGWCQQEGG